MKSTPVIVGSVAVAFATLAWSPPARAQDDSAPFANPPPPSAAPMAAVSRTFGGAGQWVGSMRTGPGSGYAYFHKPSGGDWEISLHPAVDYFITSRISVGGVVGYTHSPRDMGTNILDVGARAGFNLDIASAFSIWPMAGIAGRVHRAQRVTDTSTALQIFAPFLWHPAGHVFVGLGPEFQAGLSGGDYTEYGVDFIIGGWL